MKFVLKPIKMLIKLNLSLKTRIEDIIKKLSNLTQLKLSSAKLK